MIKIGLAGKMASGKTEIANYFISTHGGVKVSFANQLKEDVENFGLTVDGKIVKSRDRKLLQDYGQFRRGEIPFLDLTHIGRRLFNLNGLFIIEDIKEGKRIMYGKCEPDHWLNQGIIKANNFVNEGHNVIFDDLRFVNEASTLMSGGFTIIKVHADQWVREERLLKRDGGFNPQNFLDVSETQFDEIESNYNIHNNTDDDFAKKQLDEIVTFLKKLE